MGSFEYYQTSFSYTLQETGEERFVGVPEQGGRDLISADPLSPGNRLHRWRDVRRHGRAVPLEVSVSSGTGKLKMAGGVSGAMKESIQRAFSYLQAKKAELGIARDLDTSDFHVEVIDLLGQPRRGRGRRRLLRGRLLGPAEGARQPRLARARRHERPGQHQAAALADRAAPGGEGQRRQAGADPDREQARVLDWHQRLAYSAWRFSIAMHRSTGVRVHLIISCPMPFEGAAVAMERGIR